MTPVLMFEQVRKHPDFSKAGMLLFHNGIVREKNRAGKEVAGLVVTVNHDLLKQIVDEQKSSPGIVDIMVHIEERKFLKVGDDVMYLLVAGDIRENVIEVMSRTLNLIKSKATFKNEHYK